MQRCLLVLLLGLSSSLSSFSVNSDWFLGAGSTALFPQDYQTDLSAAASLRWNLRSRLIGPLGFSSSTVFNAANSLLLEPQFQFSPIVSGRSLVFQRRFGEGPRERFSLELDQAYRFFEKEAWSIKAGRQPLNLATNFYLSPNDFFSPYKPQQFFRVYKAGVDAARVSWGFSNFGSAELIGVLGYEPTLDDGQVSRHDISAGGAEGRSSLLGRSSLGFSIFEVSAFAGRVLGSNLAGGSLQLDPGGRYLVSAEYNRRLSDSPLDPKSCGQHWAAGISFQANAESSLRLEVGDPEGNYDLKGISWILGANLQLHPLIGFGSALQINKLGGFLSSNLNINAFDNTDISITGLIAHHNSYSAILLPSGLRLQPPHQLTIEIRQFF